VIEAFHVFVFKEKDGMEPQPLSIVAPALNRRFFLRSIIKPRAVAGRLVSIDDGGGLEARLHGRPQFNHTACKSIRGSHHSTDGGEDRLLRDGQRHLEKAKTQYHPDERNTHKSTHSHSPT